MATVTVRGTATVPAEPDEATVALIVSSLRDTLEPAYREVGQRAQLLHDVTDELEIERSRLSTAGISVAAEIEWIDGRQQTRGYRATSRTQVRVRDAALVARLLELAVARAEAHVEGPWWSIDQDNPARLEACRRAAQDARRKAEAYAEALGARLGALEAVAEPGLAAPSPRQPVALAAMAEAPATIPVDPGQLAVAASVDVTYRLEQA